MDPFQDRVAVITGGAGGIGMAMARAFAERGAKLVLADLQEEQLAEAERELGDRGVEVLCQVADVTKRESMSELAERTYERFGATHILCNNAGIVVVGPLVEATPADWEFTFQINFWGVVNGVQAFLPRMLESGEGGHIVNTASMSGLTGMLWLGVYAASKFAVVGYTESLSRELRPRGIGVSLLCPMMVDTKLNENTQALLEASDLGPISVHVPPPGDLKGGVASAEEVARRVVRAIERDSFYILTHPEQREILRRRAALQDSAFEPENWELD